MRLEADAILFSGATETGGLAAFVPGLGLGLASGTAIIGDTAASTITIAGGITPGAGFLASNGYSLRAVAACTQVCYPGTELNRSGIIGIGVMSAGTLIPNMTTADGGGNAVASPQALRIACQHVERMPATMVEARWFPGDEDANPYNYASRPTAWAQALNGRNAIVVSASGFPVSTGIRIRNVAVYEISLGSSTTTGQVQSISAPRSINTSGHVLKFLADKDPQWYLHTAQKIGRAIGSVIDYAATGMKAAGTAVNGLALLAA